MNRMEKRMNRSEAIIREFGDFREMCRWVNPDYECKIGCPESGVEKVDPCPFIESEKWEQCKCYQSPEYWEQD